MSTTAGPYNRPALGKRRLSKQNKSSTTLTALNTSTATLNPSNLSLRPSPASSRSDGLPLSPAEDPRSPAEGRPPGSAPTSASDAKDRGFGIKEKMSRTGTMLGKRASFRLGSLRSQSETSLVESPAERARVLEQIKEKAAQDQSRAYEHAVACNTHGAASATDRHPVRRRSMLTPGLATRDGGDPLRRMAPGGSQPHPMDHPPMTAPLARPPPPAVYGASYRHPAAGDRAPLERLAPLDLAEGDLSRSATPSECDYGRLGVGLRITNGMASPSPSLQSGRWGSSSPGPPTAPALVPNGPDGRPYGSSDHPGRAKPTLKSRLYMIETLDRSPDEDEANIHPAFRRRPSPSHVSDPARTFADQYQSDLASSPYDSPVDTNKPLPTPPGADIPAIQIAHSAESSLHSRSKSSVQSRSNVDRPDLNYRRRDSLDGDMQGRQEHLYDETLSLLESIGSEHSDASRPQLTTSTTHTSVTTPSSASFQQHTPERETSAGSNKSGTKVVTTGSITSTVRTTFGARPELPSSVPQQTSFTSTTVQSTVRSPAREEYASANNRHGPSRLALARNGDSGYSSTSDYSQQTDTMTSHPREALRPQPSNGHERPALRFDDASYEPRVRPSLASPPHSTPSHSYNSSQYPSSSSHDSSQYPSSDSYNSSRYNSTETTTTLSSVNNALGPASPTGKRRLQKLRPSSLSPVPRSPVPSPGLRGPPLTQGAKGTNLPPTGRQPVHGAKLSNQSDIPVQGQKINYSGFIPPIPTDIMARHVQRSANFPPLAQTVPHVYHAKKHSGNASPAPVPVSAPLKYSAEMPRSATAQHSDARSPHLPGPKPLQHAATMPVSAPPPQQQQRLQQQQSPPPPAPPPKHERKTSRSFFSRRVFSPAAGKDKIAEPPAIKTAPGNISRNERRASHGAPSPDEVDSAINLDEVAGFYGASPYDAASPAQLYNPYRQPQTQHRRANTMDSYMTHQQQRQVPTSAPASEQHFATNRYANRYANTISENAREDSYDEHPHTPDDDGRFANDFDAYPEKNAPDHATHDEDHCYHNTSYTDASPPAPAWHGPSDAWAERRHQAGSDAPPRPHTAHPASDQPVPNSPRAHPGGDHYRRESDRSHSSMGLSPPTPADDHWGTGGHDQSSYALARYEGGYGAGRYDGGYAAGGYGDTRYTHHPDVDGAGSGPGAPTAYAEYGRYDGGFNYGYEPGQGVNGSAGTRGPASQAAHRKSGPLSNQYGIDLSDVPVFVAARAMH